MNREVVPLCRMPAAEQRQPALLCFRLQWPLFACLGSAQVRDLSDWLSSWTAMTQQALIGSLGGVFPLRQVLLQVILSFKRQS